MYATVRCVGGTTLGKLSLVDSIEIALIELQYALADYYCRSESDFAVDPAAIETPLRELRSRATSTQLAIHLARDIPSTSGDAPPYPPVGSRKNTQD